MFLVPIGLAVLSLGSLSIPSEHAIPLWAFIGVIIAFDVAHVWATVYRTYFDPGEFHRRPWLYLLPIPVCVYLSYRLHLVSASLFWTLLAYIAIFHFIKQNYGFVSLYRIRGNETSSVDYHLDKWAVWAGALGPVLWWHASPTRMFDWFNAGEKFIFQIDPALEGDIVAIYGATALAYIARQIYVYRTSHWFNPAKNLVMAGHWFTWLVGIWWFEHPLISAAFLNLFHGIPFLILILHCGRHKWRGHEPVGVQETLLVRVFSATTWVPFFVPIFLLAFFEETLWDAMVWGEYLPGLTSWTLPEITDESTALIVAVLSLPQILHYFLDAWIWKLDGSNPDLDGVLIP